MLTHINPAPKPNYRINSDDTKIGDLMVITEAHKQYHGHLLLRVYGLLVSLTDPKLTWSSTGLSAPFSGVNFQVKLLESDQTVTLKQE